MSGPGTYLADAACTCRYVGHCQTCIAWDALIRRAEARLAALKAEPSRCAFPLPAAAAGDPRKRLRLVWANPSRGTS